MAARSAWLGRLPKKPGASTASSTRRRLLRMRASRGAVPMMAAISSSRRGFCFKQREQLHARRQLGQEPVEADEGEIGIGGLGERLDQHRLHLGQQLAGARRAHGGIAAVMPAAHGGDHLGGPLVAHAGERLDGAGIVGFAGKHHVGAAARQLGAVLEQANVVALHAFQLGGQARGEGAASAKPQKRASAGELVGIVGQRLGLLVGDHLQAMLDRAQEAIGLGQLAPARRR